MYFVLILHLFFSQTKMFVPRQYNTLYYIVYTIYKNKHQPGGQVIARPPNK